MAKPGTIYTGPVGFRHPWHYAVSENGDLNLKIRLVSEPDGTYIVAGPEDLPHHERYHEVYAEVAPGGLE